MIELSFPYGSAYKGDYINLVNISTEYHRKSTTGIKMEDDPSIASKKRSMQYINSSEMQWKFKSKQDLYVYLDEHRKYLRLLILIPM